MYLLLLGIIAVGAGILLVYYSLKDKKSKNVTTADFNPKDKGKVIYLFDEEDDGSGFSDPKKPEQEDAEEKKDEAPKEPDKEDD